MEQQALPSAFGQPTLRARVRAHGDRSLGDVELLTLLIGTGQREADALATAQALLVRYGSLYSMGRASLDELCSIPHMTEARACVVLAALEIGRRRASEQVPERCLVRVSADAYALLRPVLADLSVEEFWLLHLDRGGRLIERERISIGGVSGTVADPKVIYHSALGKRCSSLVLAHNHPSGQLRPSEEDISLTRKLVQGGRLLDVTVMDHLIVTDGGYYSFADNGML